jgi:hypothetical protein
VHGSEKCFLKFINAGKMVRANLLILSGDLTGKVFIPIVQDGDTWTADVLGTARVAKTAEDLRELEKDLRNAGYYFSHCTRDQLEMLRAKKEEQDRFFTKQIDDTILGWVNLAEDRLKDTGVRCYISPGNDDRFSIDEVLKSSEFVVNPEERVVKIDDYHEMITLGWSNITPWNSQRECSEEELGQKIEQLASAVEKMDGCIFNLHCPPFNSHLDIAPKVGSGLKVSTDMVPVGSTAVREAIEKHQPLLGLHGHIHESRGHAKIGRTLCFNPGSEYTEGIMRAYIINLDEKGVKSYQPMVG